MVIGFGNADLSKTTQQSYMSFVLKEPSDDAVDITGWKLSRQGGSSWQFPAGELGDTGSIVQQPAGFILLPLLQ